MSARSLCPRCDKVVRFRRDGAYGVHTRGVHYCTASGLTPTQVREGKTRLGELTKGFLADQAQGQTSPSRTEGDR